MSVNWIKNFAKKMIYGKKASSELYIKYLRTLGMGIGDDVSIYVPTKTVIDGSYPWMITIGNHVRIAQGAILLTHDYAWSVLKGEMDGAICGASGHITIGNNVFIGMNAIITRGVTVGNNVIIGAGSVVTKDCADNGVYAGNPARRIAELSDYFEKRKKAQISEAKELALRYYERFHQYPPKEVFHEYFMLFESAESAVKQEWCRRKLQLCGNEDESIAYMGTYQRPFENYEEFLRCCFNDYDWSKDLGKCNN